MLKKHFGIDKFIPIMFNRIMEVMLGVLMAVCLIMGVLKSYSRSKDYLEYELLFKTCGSLSFVCLGILSFYLSGTDNMVYALAIIIALILGLLGDIFLCLYDILVIPKRKDFVQYVGVTFFFLGHICYMFNFLSLASLKLYLLPCVVIMPIIYLILALTKKVQTNALQNVFLTIYFLALNLILVASVNLLIVREDTVFPVLVLIASVLFISSDVVLGLSWFAPSAKLHKHYDFYIILSYFLAQCLYAISIYFV